MSPQVKEDILNEFYQVCLAQQYIAEGGIGYAKELLDKALGQEKAQEVISKLTASLQVRPFEFVRKTDPSQLLNFIQDEHPQTIAMILSYLTAPQASMVLGRCRRKTGGCRKRIAMMDRTSPDVIKEVERVLERKLSSLVNQDYTIVGGVDAIVSILNAVDRSTEKHIMESLEIEEPELADEIRKKMFVFEDGSDGKHAVTHYRVLKRYGYVTLIECRLETGRTHQHTAVHMQWKGHPRWFGPYGTDDGGDRILKGTTFNKYKQFIENCFAAMPRPGTPCQKPRLPASYYGRTGLFESELPEDFRTVLAKWDAYAAAGLAEE